MSNRKAVSGVGMVEEVAVSTFSFSRRRIFAGAAGTLIALACFVLVTADSGPYTYTFNGAPAGPESMFDTVEFDVQVHENGMYWNPDGVSPQQAQHGSDCSAPPATHAINAPHEAFFRCKDHVMTATGGGYSLVYLTPSRMLDWSGGEATLSVDVSTYRASGRDWWDLWLTEFSANAAVPLSDRMGQAGVDLNGPPPGDYLHLNLMEQSFFKAEDENGFIDGDTQAAYSASSSTQRDTFLLTINSSTFSFCKPSENLCWFKNKPHGLSVTQAVVQLGHHAYDPTKACNPSGQNCQGTFHWDNLQMSDSVAFTLIRTTSARTFSHQGTITWGTPAPANSYLRFSAIGGVTINGQHRIPQMFNPATNASWSVGHFNSYLIPIPQGSTSATYASDNIDQDWRPCSQHGCVLKDAAIFSAAAGSSPPANTATPTKPASTATATPTSAPGSPPPPTATPANSPTTVPSGTSGTGGSAPLVGSRIPWEGSDWYLNGVNMPWYSWGCDFGCGANGGVVSSQAAIEQKFAQLKAKGVHNVRWWVFPGNPWQITRDSNGTPTGISQGVYADMDAALALAEKYDLYFNFVLFSAPGDVPSGWLTDGTKRAGLASSLGTMFARYGSNPRIISWEVFNEPEWDIWNGRVSQSAAQATVRDIASAVHANSNAYVTVGAAMLDGLPMWKGLGLDYYRAHWYDYMSSGNWCAICTDYNEIKSRYQLDKPLVIGEMYAGPDIPALQRLEAFYAKGFAGATAWSLFSEKTNDGMQVDLNAAGQFASAHNDDGPSNGNSSPPSPPPATATPTKTPTGAAATPTKTPTSPMATPTNTPTPTATATVAPQADFSATASVSGGSLRAGQTLRITAQVKSSTAASALIDIEIYGPDGQKIYQRVYDNESFSAGKTKSFSTRWLVPWTAPKGVYTVKIGVFSPGWGTLYTWNDAAATFKVK
jgi:hypothetical protein